MQGVEWKPGHIRGVWAESVEAQAGLGEHGGIRWN